MGTHGQGDGASTTGLVWRGPTTSLLRGHIPCSPRTSAPRHGQGQAHAGHPSPSETRWPPSTETAVEYTVAISLPRGRMRVAAQRCIIGPTVMTTVSTEDPQFQSAIEAC